MSERVNITADAAALAPSGERSVTITPQGVDPHGAHSVSHVGQAGIIITKDDVRPGMDPNRLVNIDGRLELTMAQAIQQGLVKPEGDAIGEPQIAAEGASIPDPTTPEADPTQPGADAEVSGKYFEAARFLTTIEGQIGVPASELIKSMVDGLVADANGTPLDYLPASLEAYAGKMGQAQLVESMQHAVNFVNSTMADIAARAGVDATKLGDLTARALKDENFGPAVVALLTTGSVGAIHQLVRRNIQ